MFDEPLPSKEDLKILKKLDKQGDDIIEDLFTIFSYHRPKEYKVYIENIKYNPLDKNRIILDLIFTIQKYNKLVKKEMEIFHEKAKNNKNFSDLYNASKKSGNVITGKTCVEILNNLIPKYEEKHLRFPNEFLEKNIFHKSGLLPNTFTKAVEFFDAEIKTNGAKSNKSFKYIKFIEKLYKHIQKAFKRTTTNNALMIFENQKDKLYQQKQEKIMEKNMERMIRNEIRLDKIEIEKLKMLNDIADITYKEIMKSINKRKIEQVKKIFKYKKTKDKIKTKTKNEEINTSEEKEKDNMNDADNIINIKTNKDLEEKTTQSKFNTVYNDKYNRTLSMEKSSNATFFNNNQATTTTKFIDSKNNTLSNYFYLYNVHQKLLNKLKNLKIRKEKLKEKVTFKPSLVYTKTLSRNKSDKSLFPEISKKGIIDENKQINLMINPVIDFNTKNNQILKPGESSSLIVNFGSKNKITISSNRKGDELHFKKIKGKRINLKKNEKLRPSKTELLIEHKRKVPIIYEELRKIKNLLNMSRKDTSKSSRAYELFTELYGKKRVFSVDEKKASKELYNSYYNMRINIERKDQHESIYKKYINMIDKNLEQNLEKGKEQDQNLKTTYLDLVDVMIKKKLDNEDEKFSSI